MKMSLSLLQNIVLTDNMSHNKLVTAMNNKLIHDMNVEMQQIKADHIRCQEIFLKPESRIVSESEAEDTGGNEDSPTNKKRKLSSSVSSLPSSLSNYLFGFFFQKHQKSNSSLVVTFAQPFDVDLHKIPVTWVIDEHGSRRSDVHVSDMTKSQHRSNVLKKQYTMCDGEFLQILER